jgi:hypothetical protein
MSNISAAIDLASLEVLINQVRGVMAVRIVLDDQQHQIDEIHVVGSPDRSAKQIVRDIESVLFVRGGVRVNHRKISLVQLLETSIRPTVERVRLVQNVQVRQGPQPVYSVVLAIGDRQVHGEFVNDTPLDLKPERGAGLATLQALDQLVNPASRLTLDHIQHQGFGPLEICMALVTHSEDDAVESMLGVSIVRNDLPTAAVRAVLDAVNRRLPYLMRQA